MSRQRPGRACQAANQGIIRPAGAHLAEGRLIPAEARPVVVGGVAERRMAAEALPAAEVVAVAPTVVVVEAEATAVVVAAEAAATGD